MYVQGRFGPFLYFDILGCGLIHMGRHMHMEAKSQPQVSLLGCAVSLWDPEFQDSAKLAVQVSRNLYISAPLPTSPQSNHWWVPLCLDFMWVQIITSLLSFHHILVHFLLCNCDSPLYSLAHLKLPEDHEDSGSSGDEGALCLGKHFYFTLQ